MDANILAIVSPISIFSCKAYTANMTTHTSAKFSVSSIDFIWTDECPPCISSIAAIGFCFLNDIFNLLFIQKKLLLSTNN